MVFWKPSIERREESNREMLQWRINKIDSQEAEKLMKRA
jgi:hypothetical protein